MDRTSRRITDLMFEVIESSSVEFGEALDGAKDLDAIIHAHRAFLAAVEAKAMLRPQDEPTHTALKQLFDAILQFARAQATPHRRPYTRTRWWRAPSHAPTPTAPPRRIPRHCCTVV